MLIHCSYAMVLCAYVIICFAILIKSLDTAIDSSLPYAGVFGVAKSVLPPFQFDKLITQAA